MAYCITCGNQLIDNAKFCSACGFEVQQLQSESKSNSQSELDLSEVQKQNHQTRINVGEDKYEVCKPWDDYEEVELDGKYGFKNSMGVWIIKPQFDSVNYFDENGYCEVELNDKYGFINHNHLEHWVVHPVFDSLGSFDEKGYCDAESNEKWGFINSKGQWIIEPRFDSVDSFDKNGYCCVLDFFDYIKGYNKIAWIDRNGEYLIEPLSHKGHCDVKFDENDRAVLKSESGKKGLIDRTGKWIVLPEYFLLECAGNNSYKASKNNKYGYIDKSGNWIKEPANDYILYDFEGIAMTWNEISQEWNLSDVRNKNSIEFSLYFGDFKNSTKVYLSDYIPSKKLDAFSSSFDSSFIQNCKFEVYYDDTIWGKGDNGFAIVEFNKKDYSLLINEFAGEVFGFTFREDYRNPCIVDVAFDKKLHISYRLNGNVKTLSCFNNTQPIAVLYDLLKANIVNQNDDSKVSEILEQDRTSPIKPKDGAGLR